MTWYPLLTSLLMSVLVTSSVAQSGALDLLKVRYACPRESLWTLTQFISFATEITDTVCYTVVNAQSYDMALEYCHQQQASLLAPTMPYTQYSTTGEASLVDFLSENGVSTFWYGYHVTDDRLKKDTFPMTQERDDRFQSDLFNDIPWYTNDTHRMHSEPQGTSQCFEMAVNRSVECSLLVDDQPGESVPTGSDGRRRRSVWSPESLLLWRPDAKVKAKIRQRRDLGLQGSARVRVKRAVGSTDCEVKRVSVRSRDCGASLPFVCVKPALVKGQTFLSTVNTLCERDEFGHLNIPGCFSYGQESVDQVTAEFRCRAKARDGRPPRTLYRSEADSDSYLGSLIVTAIVQNISQAQKEPVWQNKLAWVAGSEAGGGRECLAISMDTGDVLSWECSALLPFYVCQSDVSLPGVGRLTMDVFDTSETQPFPFKIEAIAGSDDREVSVPVSFSFPGADFSPSLSCAYYGQLTPGLQTMTLVKSGVPLRQYPPLVGLDPGRGARSVAEDGQETSVSINLELRNGRGGPGDGNVRNMTDYYWCEINDLQTGQVHRSGRVFVRTTGEKIYAVSIAMSSTSPIRPFMILQSLFGLEDALTGQTGSPFSRLELNHRLVRYRPELVPPESERTIVDLLVFQLQDGEGDAGPNLLSAEKLIADSFRALVERTELNLDLSTLEVRSIDTCPATTVYDPVSDELYQIPETNLGKVYTSPGFCLSNGEPYVRLICEGDKLYGARWSEFKPTPGCQFDDEDTSEATATLKSISESSINEESLDEVIKNTTEVVESIDSFAPVDLVYLADILQQATDLDSVSIKNAKEILQLVDLVAGTNKTVLEESNKLGNATNRILRAIDQLGDKIELDEGAPDVRVVSDSTALEVWDLSRVTGDVIVGLELLLDGEEPVPVLDSKDLVSLFETYQPSYTDTDAAIFLPGSFIRRIQSVSQGKDIRLSMNVFAQTALFQSGRLEQSPKRLATRAVLNSKVIAAKVSVGGVAIVNLGDHNVTTVFLPVQTLPPESHAGNSTCVFWDFLGSGGQGAWSPRGCRYHQTKLGRDVCVCDHLTNFAVLLDFYGQSALPEKHQLALTVITIIGLSLSIAGLACTVISFIFIKKLRQGKPQQTMFNMALAMLASWVVFLAGFDRVENYTGCLAVAALLHYFILASFMWMLMEAVLQYLLFVKVLGYDFHNYLLKTSIPSWGLPLIPVIVVLAIDPDLYHGGEHYCWMSLTPFYYAFLAPVALIILINIIVYVMVVVNICRRGNIGSSSSSSGSKRVVGIRASVACFVALGLSWVFAFFAVEDARVVFQYLFTITATLQGFLIFLIFTVRDPSVRAYWKQLCCRCCTGKGKTDKSSSSSSANNRKPKGQGMGGAGGRDLRSDDVPLSSSEQSGSSSNGNLDSRTTSPSHLSSPVSSGPGLEFEN